MLYGRGGYRKGGVKVYDNYDGAELEKIRNDGEEKKVLAEMQRDLAEFEKIIKKHPDNGSANEIHLKIPISKGQWGYRRADLRIQTRTSRKQKLILLQL